MGLYQVASIPEKVAYLRHTVDCYKEMEMLAGPAEASPEGNPLLKPDALSYEVFDCPVDATAIEAERTFLGLVLFRAVLKDDKSFFPHLSPRSFGRLRRFTLAHAPDAEDQTFVSYSLACNDLGKTQILIDASIMATGRKALDHDRLLAEMVSACPGLFPGLYHLTALQQDMFRAALNTNFNLGQMTQGENLPADLALIQHVDSKTRMLRLIAELYDFAGATGHVCHDRSILLNEDNLAAYLMAITQLNRAPYANAYQRYIRLRAHKAGITHDEQDSYVLGRIIALSRTFTLEKGELVREVWRSLPASTRTILQNEMGEADDARRPGILLYYAPALIANAVKSFDDFRRGLTYALEIFASQFEKARAGDHHAGEAVIIVNIADLARQAAHAGSR